MSSANIKVTASVLSVDIDKPKTVIPQADYGSVEVDIQGLGETNYPEPRQFKYTDDTYSIVDNGLKFNIKPNIYDIKTTNTIISFNNIKPINNTYSTYDTINLLNNYIRYYSDTYSYTDRTSIDTSKYLSDYYSYLDQITLKTEFVRNFTDYIYSTDDVLGNLNADDDQYAYVGKGIVLNYSYYDSITTQTEFNRSFISNTVNNDLIYVSIDNNYIDENSIVDTYNIVAAKSLETSYSNTDEVSKDINRTLIDSGYFLEDYAGYDYEYGSFITVEYLLNNINKILSTTTSKIDSTHIGLQNYSYGNYVESGYVGIQQIV